MYIIVDMGLQRGKISMHLIDTQLYPVVQAKLLQQIEPNNVRWLKHNVILFHTHVVIPSRCPGCVVDSSLPLSNPGIQPSSILSLHCLVGYGHRLQQNGRNRKSMEWAMWEVLLFKPENGKHMTSIHIPLART